MLRIWLKDSVMKVVPENEYHELCVKEMGYDSRDSAIEDGWNRVVFFAWKTGDTVLALESNTLAEAHEAFTWVNENRGVMPDVVLLDTHADGINAELRGKKSVLVFLRYGRIVDPTHLISNDPLT